MTVYRRLSPKFFAYSAISVTILLCVYYASYTTDYSQKTASPPRKEAFARPPNAILSRARGREPPRVDYQTCPRLMQADADINTMDVFKEFEFTPSWMKTKEYWDKSFDDRYERQKMDSDRPPLKVIIVPHSHNDPGWLKTFEHYFHYQSRQIMNHMVAKLQQYKNLTFIWSEVAFLNAWWEEAHPSKQRALRELVHAGRLEVVTGGWVMTDEATAHVYAMVDQLIEGHQWVASNLGVKPTAGWSVDPFGHGGTVPYLLAKSGVRGTVVQRIHYAWKQWLALKQYGDFRWVPSWTPADASSSMLTHNQPFDIYSIKHSCGPHPYICLNFDFRKVMGEYTEYSIKAQAITDKNLKEKAELLLEQYARTGSLFPHNVVLVPLGDDFRYNVIEEWDQQYTNYMKLINFINENRETYKAEIKFGTPSDYFDAITHRYDQFPTLRGDFFVYSDIFAEGRPAYWSGYFTTRPYMKLLDRELEHALRGAEILYSVALNVARQRKRRPHIKILERDFEKLVRARRNLGLFQHHDAITGTSKSFVMRDYGLKLFEGIRDATAIQQNAIESLMFSQMRSRSDAPFVLSDLERDAYEKVPKKWPVTVGVGQSRKVLLYNALAQEQEHIVKIRTNTSDIKVVDPNGVAVVFQVNPVWEQLNDDGSHMTISSSEYEVVFVVRLPPLSVSTYEVAYDGKASPTRLATIYCNKCGREASKFNVKRIPPGDIQLENHKLKILFDGTSGLMKTLTRKRSPKIMRCAIEFGAYRSAQFHSGAYLFMPDPNEREIEKDVLQPYRDKMAVLIASGPVASELTTVYGAFLAHSVAIFHDDSSSLSHAIEVENVVDFGTPPKNRETEMFMRVITDVQNGDPPEFFTDANGFQTQRRVKVEKIGIEGNYFPITTMAFIQDEKMRVSLLTTHAQGAAAWTPGALEVMLDRRTLYDDSRGMGEGVVDNRATVHKFWLLVEDVAAKRPTETVGRRFDDDAFEKDDVLRRFNAQPTDADARREHYQRPSLFANHLSNSLIYPASVFVVDAASRVNGTLRLLNTPFPCDVHLMNLRTQPDALYAQFPSSSALLVLHRQGYDCAVSGNYTCGASSFDSACALQHARVKSIESRSLTGLDSLDDVVTRFADIYVEPMALKTFNITFE